MPAQDNENKMQNFFKEFSNAFLSDDIDGFMKFIDKECEWVIVATGETFRGIDKVRELAERSIVARKHTSKAHIKFINHMICEDQLCLEYIHQGIITEAWPASENRPPPGSKFELPICLVCYIKDKKFVKVNEYFDLGTLIAGSRRAKLYS